MPLALAVCGVLGYAVERWLVRPLYQRPFDTLVVTWGLSLLLRKCAEAMFGLGYKSLDEPIGGTVEVLGATYPRYRLRADRGQRRRPRRARALVRHEPHRHAHPGDGRQPRARARARHSGARYASATFVIGTCLAGPRPAC